LERLSLRFVGALTVVLGEEGTGVSGVVFMVDGFEGMILRLVGVLNEDGDVVSSSIGSYERKDGIS